LPLIGGNIQNFAAFRREAGISCPADVPEMSFDSLLRNHGTEYRQVINTLKSDEEMPIMIPGTATLTAEILHSVQSEMAVRLEDVVLRRTELGTQCHPGHRTIQFVAHVMAAQLKWSTARISEEIAQTEHCLLKHHAVASKASQLESWPSGANAGLTAQASA
jgi:glycerol-3-phosphate dehydrogenase